MLCIVHQHLTCVLKAGSPSLTLYCIHYLMATQSVWPLKRAWIGGMHDATLWADAFGDMDRSQATCSRQYGVVYCSPQQAAL